MFNSKLQEIHSINMSNRFPNSKISRLIRKRYTIKCIQASCFGIFQTKKSGKEKQRRKSKTTAKQSISLGFFLNLIYCLYIYLADFTEDFDKRHHCCKIKLHDRTANIVVLWAINVGIYERNNERRNKI